MLLPVLIKTSPALDKRPQETLDSKLLWVMHKREEIEDFIEEEILGMRGVKPIKSGLIVFRDLEKNVFKQIVFRGKNIMKPEPSNVTVRLVKEGPKGLTQEEKIEMLEQFIGENHALPKDDDVFEYEDEDSDGNVIVKQFRVGTFYNSLVKSREKYQDILERCGGDNEGGNHAGDVRGSDDAETPTPALRGGRGVSGRRNAVRRGGATVDVEQQQQEEPFDDEIDLDTPTQEVPKADKPNTKQGKKQ